MQPVFKKTIDCIRWFLQKPPVGGGYLFFLPTCHRGSADAEIAVPLGPQAALAMINFHDFHDFSKISLGQTRGGVEKSSALPMHTMGARRMLAANIKINEANIKINTKEFPKATFNCNHTPLCSHTISLRKKCQHGCGPQSSSRATPRKNWTGGNRCLAMPRPPKNNVDGTHP